MVDLNTIRGLRSAMRDNVLTPITFATAADLRAVSGSKMLGGEVVSIITGTDPGMYCYVAGSTETDDGSTTIKPSDIDVASAGRWKLFNPVAAAGAADPVDLDYFTQLGFMPANELVLGGRSAAEVNCVFPARDFENLTGGSHFTVKNNGFTLYTGSAAAINFGWDAGALKSKALIILGGLESNGGTEKCGLFAGKTTPPLAGGGGLPDGVPADAYMGILSIVGSGDFAIGETDGAGNYAELANATNGAPDFNVFFSTTLPKIHGIAFYVDGTNNIQKLFVKYAPGTWYEVVAAADVTVTQFQYFGIYMDAIGAAPWFNRGFGPIRVFVE